MRKSISRNYRLIIAAIMSLLMVMSAALSVYGSNTITVDVTGTYGQTEARSMLSDVNDFRTGRYIDGGKSAVWAYASDESIDTASYTGLGELQYDYELEKVAMQRAMDLVLQFDHERPNHTPYNGRSSESLALLYPSGYSTTGENLATGYGNSCNTAEKAFADWCETNYSYDGQGHRRNMLDRRFNRIGIAHVVVHYSGNLTEGDRPYLYSTDIHYWVQEFGYRTDSFGLTETDAVNTERTLPIEVLDSNIDYLGVDTDAEQYEMDYGETMEFNGASSVIQLKETWPKRFSLRWTTGESSTGPYYVKVGGGYSIQTANTSIATASGRTITAKKAGTTNIIVRSQLDANAQKTVQLKVNPASLADADVTVSGSYAYNGSAYTPAPVVKLGGKTLSAGTDYDVNYSDNTNAGTAKVIVTGKGNYKDSAEGTFTISPKPISGAHVELSNNSFTFNGSIQTPEVSSVNLDGTELNGTDYDISAPDSRNKGSYAVTVTGKGNYTGSVTAGYSIGAKELAEEMIALEWKSREYNGEVQIPAVTVSDGDLMTSDDYSIEDIEEAIECGTYDVTVKAKGNYTGEVTVNFSITKIALADDMIVLEPASFTYTGSLQAPVVTVRDGDTTLQADREYTLSNAGGVDAGTYTVSVTANSDGHYKGSAEKSYIINRADIGNAQITEISSLEYSGSAHEPAPEVSFNGQKLTAGEDYEVNYSDNTNAGTANAVITGKGNFKGEKSQTFTIFPKQIEADLTDIEASYVYTGNEIKPGKVVIKGEETELDGRDAVISYSGNINVSDNATVSADPKDDGNYAFEHTEKSFSITPADIGDASIAEIADQKYTGIALIPALKVNWKGRELKAGEDYEAEFTDNIEEGTAKVIITGTGNFSGTNHASFTIVKEDPSDEDQDPSGGGQQPSGEDKSPSEGNQQPSGEDRGPADGSQAQDQSPVNRTDIKGEDGTALGKGASVEAAEAAITGMKNDKDPSGTVFGLLQLSSTKQTNNSLTLKWKRLPGAVKYVVYGNKCGNANKMKRLAQTTARTMNITKVVGKAVKKGTYYKFMIIALDKNNNVVSSSKIIHVAAKGGKVGNVGKITVSKKVRKNTVSVKKGQKFKLGAKQIAAGRKLKVRKHRALMYETSNKDVASVSSRGEIKGKKKGSCCVYVYAQNGVFNKINVVVK